MPTDRAVVRRTFLPSLLALSGVFAGTAAVAIDVARDDGGEVALRRAYVAPELAVAPQLEAIDATDAASRPGLAGFLARHGAEWEVRWDVRAGRPALVQGSGVPLFPGRGNRLTPEEFGLAPGARPDLAFVERSVREFAASEDALLGVVGLDFRLDPERSAVFGQGDTHWFVELRQVHDGVPVDGAALFFRVVQGNLVQFGATRVAPVALDARPNFDREAAFAAMWRDLDLAPGATISEILEKGELLFAPVTPAGEMPDASFVGVPGTGYGHRRIWRAVFRLVGEDTTYQTWFDDELGRVIEVRNLTVSVAATVEGGVFPTTNSDPEIVVPLPFVTVTNGGTKNTDAAGVYDYSGGTATATLNGQYFRMADVCGSISLADATTGDLDFGTSGGTDCTTPGVGGAGNTHASRTGFYHLTRINRKADTFFPTNTWVDSKVTANMNINQTCNANWNGTSLNFYRSGGGCSNTGEIAAVFLHEWGHGMDTNTGGAASENGSGEAVGDTFAFLETRDPCIGQNFRPGIDCPNCVACTGVRDVADFSTSGPATIASPALVASDTGINCDRFTCPYLAQGIFPYQGPMGYEGHCESVIASSANWELTQLLIAEWGTEAGWAAMDDIWYGSLTASKSAYRRVSGGTCNPAAVVDGCGSNNWYTVFLVADDDDGNVANGTPNGCRIWDAFSAHGIACGSRPACTTTCGEPATADAGSDVAVCAGTPALIGTPALPGHTYLWSPGGATTAQIEVTPGSTTVYTVTASTSCAEAQDSVTVTVNDPAPPSADAGPDRAICNGQSVQIGTPAVSGFTYLWSPGGATTAQISVSPTADTTYTVTVSNGCTSVEDSVLVDVTDPPSTPTLLAPADGAEHQVSPVSLDWTDSAGATGYSVQVALDAAFVNLVATLTPSVSNASVGGLGPLHYFWRVTASGSCAPAAVSSTFDFFVDNVIFVDGFEGGNSTAWSATVP